MFLRTAFARLIAGDPQSLIGGSEYPRSHSKCMRFCGQRHGPAFWLLWSLLAPGHSSMKPLLILSAGRWKFIRGFIRLSIA